jgi:hypothetical protein
MVLPVPGGPASRTPFGSLPPRRVKCYRLSMHARLVNILININLKNS